MIHQRVSLWLPFIFSLACGNGGAGAAVDRDWTPDEQPPVSDHVTVPPAIPNDEQQPPPPPTQVGSRIPRGGGDGGGNDECDELCDGQADRGCTTPRAECLAACNEEPDQCGPEVRTLIRCAGRYFCIEDIDTDGQGGAQIVAACPSEAMALFACLTNSP